MLQNEEENVPKPCSNVQSFLSEKAKHCVQEVQLQKMYTELSLMSKGPDHERKSSGLVNHRHKMFLPGIERGYTLTEIDTRKRDIFKLRGDTKFLGLRKEMTFTEATEFKKDYKESIPALIPLDTTKLQFSVCGKKLKNEDVKNELQTSWSQERSLTLPSITRCFSPRLSKEPIKFKPQKFTKPSSRRGKRTNKLMKSKTFIAMSDNLIEENPINAETDVNNNATSISDPAEGGRIGKAGKLMIDKSTMTDAYLWPGSPRAESESVAKSSPLPATELETGSIRTICSITENSTCETKTTETNTDLIENCSLPEISIVMTENMKAGTEKESSVIDSVSGETHLPDIPVSRKSESSTRTLDRDTLSVKENTLIYDNTKTDSLPDIESTHKEKYEYAKHAKTGKTQRPLKSRKTVRRPKIKPFSMAKSRTYVNIHVTSS